MISINEFNKIKKPGTKRCPICGEIKSLEEFIRDKRRSDGRECRCKECHKISSRKYNREQREKKDRSKYNKKYRERRKEMLQQLYGPSAKFIYIFRWDRFYKIGRAKDPQSRMATINASLPFNGELVCIIPTNNMVIAERHLHDSYSHLRRGGEWFELLDSDINSLCAVTFIQADGNQVTLLSN